MLPQRMRARHALCHLLNESSGSSKRSRRVRNFITRLLRVFSLLLDHRVLCTTRCLDLLSKLIDRRDASLAVSNYLTKADVEVARGQHCRIGVKAKANVYCGTRSLNPRLSSHTLSPIPHRCSGHCRLDQRRWHDVLVFIIT